MEKFRIFIFVVFLGVAGILVYSLSKGLFMLDRGIKVKEETGKQEKIREEIVRKSTPEFEDSRMVFEDFLYYAVDLNKGSGGYGPDEILSQAKNLVFINIKTGSLKKIFRDNVFIQDFFPGSFTRKKEIRGFDEPEIESINIGERFIIIAVVNDTNDDGFLNQKDEKKVFVYHPASENLTTVLPGDYYFDKLYYNTAKNHLAFLVKKQIKTKKKKKEEAQEEERHYFYLYNVTSNKGKIISPSSQD